MYQTKEELTKVLAKGKPDFFGTVARYFPTDSHWPILRNYAQIAENSFDLTPSLAREITDKLTKARNDLDFDRSTRNLISRTIKAVNECLEEQYQRDSGYYDSVTAYLVREAGKSPLTPDELTLVWEVTTYGWEVSGITPYGKETAEFQLRATIDENGKFGIAYEIGRPYLTLSGESKPYAEGAIEDAKAVCEQLVREQIAKRYEVANRQIVIARELVEEYGLGGE